MHKNNFAFTNFILRPANNKDSKKIQKLIDTVYREYGDQLDISGADRDLLDIESNYENSGGSFVVLVSDGHIVGTHAVVPTSADNACTFKRLYLNKTLRGGSAGNFLMDWAIEKARSDKYQFVEFWSDSRFERAHIFFRKFGFSQSEQVRHMSDGHMPYSEYHFSLDLTKATLQSRFDFKFI